MTKNEELMKHFRVIAIDHLGFGKSDRPNFEFNDFENSMNFFTLPIVQVIKLLNLKKLLIIGHSYSGLITSHLVPHIKDRVLGVWLVSPAGFNKKTFSEFEKKKLLEQYGETFKVGTELMEFLVYLTFEKVLKF
jgi:pimeloyl-ACP methyl ester carboxylesterase